MSDLVYAAHRITGIVDQVPEEYFDIYVDENGKSYFEKLSQAKIKAMHKRDEEVAEEIAQEAEESRPGAEEGA